MAEESVVCDEAGARAQAVESGAEEEEEHEEDPWRIGPAAEPRQVVPLARFLRETTAAESIPDGIVARDTATGIQVKLAPLARLAARRRARLSASGWRAVNPGRPVHLRSTHTSAT